MLLVQMAHDVVAFPGVDVVRADEGDPGTIMTGQVGRQRRAVLVRCRPAIDDVGRVLETLLRRGIEQQAISALDHRHHGFTGMRHVAAEHQAHAGQREHAPDIGLAAGLGEHFGFHAGYGHGGFHHFCRGVHDAQQAVLRENHQIHARQQPLPL